MCLVIKREDKPFKAKNDIVCYKAVCQSFGGNCWTGVWGFSNKTFPFDEVSEELGTNPVPYGDEERMYLRVDSGWLHSFEKREHCKTFADGVIGWRKKNRKGIGKIVVCKCVIPKGSLCYKEGGEIASTKIIVYKPNKK